MTNYIPVTKKAKLMRSLILMLISLNVLAGNDMEFRIAEQTNQEIASRIAVYNGQYQIFAEGEISNDTTQKFEAFIKKNQINNAVVILNSLGGSLIGGINLGQSIRNNKFNTSIGTFENYIKAIHDGVCASSCAYAFAGGMYRFYYGGESKLGIHQFYTPDGNIGNIGDAQTLTSLVLGHLQMMGVDSKAFEIASVTPSNTMTWLTPAQSSKLRLSNNGKELTTAEIKVADSLTYLKIEQFGDDAGARFLLSCDNGKFQLMLGIVTSPEVSSQRIGYVRQSYIELDSGEKIFTQSATPNNITASGGVIWIRRSTDRKMLNKIISSDTIGFWTESESVWRWGASLEIFPVKDKIRSFVKESTACI